MPQEFENRQVELKYSISDVCLYRLHLNGRVVRWPFSPGAAPVVEPPSPERLSEAPFYLYQNIPLAAPLPKLERLPNALRYVIHQVETWYTPLEGTFEEYLQQFSSKSRSTLRRKVRKFEELNEGPVELKLFQAVDEMPEYHRLARQVATKTYQEKLFDGAIPDTAEFRTYTEKLAAQDRIRGFILYLKGQPVAYLHLPVREDGVVDYQFLGYDPAHADASPGTVLLFLALERLFEDPKLTYFDFDYGKGQTKELFSRGSYLRADVFYFSKKPHLMAAVYAHAATDDFSEWSGRVLERLGVKATIKRLLRR
ncbi:MAG: GNAT family N-acetyltransferase [Bryobacterales bacterium]|nr:GNAT family N-acetyltransferase [Bryobacterales bacterium]